MVVVDAGTDAAAQAGDHAGRGRLAGRGGGLGLGWGEGVVDGGFEAGVEETVVDDVGVLEGAGQDGERGAQHDHFAGLGLEAAFEARDAGAQLDVGLAARSA
jgi:hypothetical protein